MSKEERKEFVDRLKFTWEETIYPGILIEADNQNDIVAAEFRNLIKVYELPPQDHPNQ
jgi:hypothetical protein